MIPLRIEGADVYLAPAGATPNCRGLYGRVVDGCVVSRWEPTPEELAVLNDGGSVELWVQGSIQPPVAVQVSPHISAFE